MLGYIMTGALSSITINIQLKTQMKKMYCPLGQSKQEKTESILVPIWFGSRRWSTYENLENSSWMHIGFIHMLLSPLLIPNSHSLCLQSEKC